MANILITICARGGSKGIPNKNIKKLLNKPLICYSLDVAISVAQELKSNVYLSTDSEEIKSVVKAYSKEVNTAYNRPEFLASDSSGKIEVIEDLLGYAEDIEQKRFDFIIDLDVTSPLRTSKDILDAYSLLKSDEQAYNIFSVSPAKRNPYFNQVEKMQNGYYKLVKSMNEDILSRQKAPQVFDLNASFYIYKRIFFEHNNVKPVNDQCLIYEMSELCFDIDSLEDFEYMEYIMMKKNKFVT